MTRQPSRSGNQKKQQLAGLVGIGLDNQDGHFRLTTGEHYLVYGGSEETHERMTQAVVHVAETLRRKGKSIPEATVQEVIDLLLDVHAAQKD